MQAAATEFLETLRLAADSDRSIDRDAAQRILDDQSLPIEALLDIAEVPRVRHFQNRVQVHILNNVRNGYCPEDCGYCAQRKGSEAPIAAYGDKSEAEILEEARRANESGAYRYCMVFSGRGPGAAQVRRVANLIRTIKEKYPLSICLSAGILNDPALAAELKAAGLDRYNHNLNTSRAHYNMICTTHDYEDRLQTLQTMRAAGVELCSGVIAGMGEARADLVEVAFELQGVAAPSIPVNFFLPTPGHAVKEPVALSGEDCLRILCMFRLVNPRAEIRMAAGRERYLAGRQAEALRVANSLFVSGYLNVRGSPAAETYAMIQKAGYMIETPEGDFARAAGTPVEGPGAAIVLKSLSDLRPSRVRQDSGN